MSPESPISLKKKFTFRLGTTSYILPDDLIPNVAFLGPLLDDVELVLFESGDISNLPDQAVIRELKRLKTRHDLSYTIHLPLDIQLGSFWEDIRKRSVEKCLEIMDLTRPLNPFAFIVHFHGDQRGVIPSADMDAWRRALTQSARELTASDIPPEDLCVETLDYPFHLISDIVCQYGLSICLDVGHLVFHGYSVEKNLDDYFSQCRVLHLHGHHDGKDHKDIGFFDFEILQTLFKHMSVSSHKDRVLTLEIFGLKDFEASMGIMEKLLGFGLLFFAGLIPHFLKVFQWGRVLG